jgi:O-antigen/teichoic acid export membrane protein
MRKLLEAVLKTGSGSAASLVFGAVAMKILAVVLGPNGVGLYSLLQQTQRTALSLAVSGRTALVQGLASKEEEEQSNYLSTVFWILSATGGLIGLVFLVFAPQIARWVMNSNDPQTAAVIRWLALPVVLGVALNYLMGVLNGHRAIGRLAAVQAANGIALALLAYPVAKLVQSGQQVALTWLMSGSLVVAGGLSLSFAYRRGWLLPFSENLRRGLDRKAARYFVSIAGTILVTGFIVAGKDLAVRSLVIRQFGLSGAGILDVAWNLSMWYVTLILTAFGAYYFPTLSCTTEAEARVDLMRRTLRLAILLAVPLIITVVVLKPLVIEVLYSNDFLPALEIIQWMLIGDFFKVTSWVLAYPMLAYADMVTFFWSELLSSGLSLGLSALALFALRWLPGIGVGFMLIYAGYLAFTLYYTRRRHHLTLETSTVLQWLGGLALIIGASIQTWGDTQVRWSAAILWIVTALAFSGLTVSKEEREQAIAALPGRFPGFKRRSVDRP